MPAKRSVDPALESKHLFIAHLAERLQAMDLGRLPMQPRAYRLCARRLREAMAGYPEAHLASRLATSHPAVAELLVNRSFDTHGVLPGVHSQKVNRLAQQTLQRMRQAR
jgi:hypothetical protein